MLKIWKRKTKFLVDFSNMPNWVLGRYRFYSYKRAVKFVKWAMKDPSCWYAWADKIGERGCKMVFYKDKREGYEWPSSTRWRR